MLSMFVLHGLVTCCATAQVCQDSLPCRMICLMSQPGSLWFTVCASWHAAGCHIESVMTLFIALLEDVNVVN